MKLTLSPDNRARVKVFGLALACRWVSVAFAHFFLPGLDFVPMDTRVFHRRWALLLLNDLDPGIFVQHLGNVPPLFSVWLALWHSVLGADAPVWALGLVSALVRAGTVVVMFEVARKLLNEEAARVAAFLMIVDPFEFLWTPVISKETLSVFLVVVSAYAMWRRLPSATAFDAGAWLVIATLTFFGAPVTALVGARLRGLSQGGLVWLASLLALPLLGALALAPLIPRIPLDGPDAIQSWMARPLFGLVGSAETRGYSGSDRAAEIDPPVKVAPSEARVGHAARVAFRGIARRAFNLCRPMFAGSKTSTVILFGITWGLLLAAAVCGFLLEPRRLLLCSGMAGTLAIAFLFTNGGIRQRQYITPWLYPAAGAALCRLKATARAGRWKPYRESSSGNAG